MVLCLSFVGCNNTQTQSDKVISLSGVPDQSQSTQIDDSVTPSLSPDVQDEPVLNEKDENTQQDSLPQPTNPSEQTEQSEPTKPSEPSQPSETDKPSESTKPSEPSMSQNQPPVHTHNYDQKVATASFMKSGATCKSSAVYYYSCSCGQKGTQTFTSESATAHSYTLSYKSPTCSSQGYTEHRCSCGESYSDNYEPMTYAHDFERLQSQGRDIYVCKNCQIEAIAHGNADSSVVGGNDKVKFYVSYVDTGYHIVIYGNGAIADFTNGNQPMWANYLYRTSKIIIAEGITAIGTNAFKCPDGQSNITFNMASSVKTIKSGAIDLNMRSITLGQGVERIQEAITGKNMTGIYLPKTLKYFGAFAKSWDSDTIIYYEGTKEEFLNITTRYYNQTVTLNEFFERYYSCDVYSPWCHVYVNCTKISDTRNYFDTMKQYKQ